MVATPGARCFVCRAGSGREAEAVAGLKGESEALREVLCSEACAGEARRFAARRGAQLGPGQAGLMVAGLGVMTAALFAATGRDLGRPLLVLSLLGAGTTRLAYPDTVPLGLVRRLGLEAALTAHRWLGVGLGLAAVGLAIVFLIA